MQEHTIGRDAEPSREAGRPVEPAALAPRSPTTRVGRFHRGAHSPFAIRWFGATALVGHLRHLVAVAAASLLYIAVADLIPGLHRRVDPRSSITQVVLIGLGVALVAFAERHAH
jgi:hypothetical protein